MLEISRDRSAFIKGVAIMMMLVYHLFGNQMADLCTNLLHVGSEPLARWLSHASGPVPFFLIVSGYGLAYKYEHRQLRFKGQLGSALRLYLHFWFVLLIFLPIGAYLLPNRYPGGLHHIILNALGWYTTYYHEMWFLFPYVCISLLSPYILRLIARAGLVWSLIIAAGIHLATSFLISSYGEPFIQQLHWPWVYKMILVLHIVFYFVVGVAFRRTTLPLQWRAPQWLIVICIAFLVIVIAETTVSIRYMIYAPLLVFLLCQVRYARWLDRIVMELGRKSMTIWMIHPWLALYLFQEQFYALRYPVLIFLGVLGASYILSIPVMWVAGKVTQALKQHLT